MDFDIEQLKKRIIYRSNYRGTKEMDKLLGNFTRKYIDKLSPEDLIDLEKLLNFDDNSLYNFYRGQTTEVNFENNNVNLLFKKFEYKKL